MTVCEQVVDFAEYKCNRVGDRFFIEVPHNKPLSDFKTLHYPICFSPVSIVRTFRSLSHEE